MFLIKKMYFILREDGWLSLIKKIIKKLMYLFNEILAEGFGFIISICILLLPLRRRIRIIMLPSDRIGHYSFSTEVLRCVLDTVKADKIKTFFYTIPGAKICNIQLHKMWKRELTILPFPKVIRKVNRYLSKWCKKYKYDEIKNYFEDGDGSDKWNLIGKIKNTTLRFTESENCHAKKIMEKLGIPGCGKFICLLGRDERYLKIYKPNSDFSYHNYRDVDINNYKQAALNLAEQGYYVVRMGKYVQASFNVDHHKVIDYANTRYRSDFMDIYLSANCWFFISVGTGLDGVAQIFRRPLLMTNIPLSDKGIWPDWRLFIPKKIKNLRTEKTLTFKETYDFFLNKGQTGVMQTLSHHSLAYIENTPEEISDAVDEMTKRLIGHWQETNKDMRLQKFFWDNFPNYFTSPIPGIDIPIYKRDDSALVGNKLRIGSSFLKNNQMLL